MDGRPEGGFILLPFYLIVDVSYSMAGSKIDAANSVLRELSDALAVNPIISDKVRFSLLDFADDASVQLPLCDLTGLDAGQLPVLEPRGGTSYASAFRELKACILHDSSQLKADGYKVHRPAVFFLSDGQPTDDDAEWRAAYQDLTSYEKESGIGNPSYPNIIPFGVEAADRQIMRDLIHPKPPAPRPMKMFMQSDGEEAAKAIASMAELLIASVLASGQGLVAGQVGVVLPNDPVEGLDSFDYDDDIFI